MQDSCTPARVPAGTCSTPARCRKCEHDIFMAPEEQPLRLAGAAERPLLPLAWDSKDALRACPLYAVMTVIATAGQKLPMDSRSAVRGRAAVQH